MSIKDQAVTITARELAELVPVERDMRPLAPREIAGRTVASLISAGTEINAAYLGSNFPAGIGYASVFEVERVGADVDPSRVGSRAVCLGGHRSWQRIDVESAAIVPEALGSEQATFARMMVVTMSTLTTTTARPPQPVLVVGLGPVGHLAAQVFASCGYDVTACDPSERRRGIASATGRCGRVLPAVPVDEAGRYALALECSGTESGVLDACRVVRKRGEVVLVGVPWRRHTDLSAHELLHAIFHNYAVVRSGWEWEIPLHPSDFRTNSIHGNLQAAVDWLASGRVVVDWLYQTISPAEAQAAYQSLMHGSVERLAVVFDWRLL
jgi:threonine dehydrogenase-like Zn-dependent dehydrogenase